MVAMCEGVMDGGKEQKEARWEGINLPAIREGEGEFRRQLSQME